MLKKPAAPASHQPTYSGPLTLLQALTEEFERMHHKLEPKPTSLEELYSEIRKLPTCRSALCISGGGIRSATFSLGVLQALAAQKFLSKFDYLSTVSGGGYIGGWLTAWLHRNPGKSPDDIVAAPGDAAQPPVNDGTAPVFHLRQYSNYLDPKLGMFSADTWTLVVTVVRNMILNWIVLIPLLAAGLLLPRLQVALVRRVSNGDLAARWDVENWIAAPAWREMFGPHPLWLPFALLFVAGALVAAAIWHVNASLPSIRRARSLKDGDRPAPPCLDQPRFIYRVIVPLFLAAETAVIAGAALTTHFTVWDGESDVVWFALGGALVHFLAWATGGRRGVFTNQ